ncbi:hypothetical protein DNTS_014393, partial [Danionella cerebrum]
ECFQAVVESDPSPRRCKLGLTLCKDGSECIVNTLLCDGEMDCTDGSDEDDCPSDCSTGIGSKNSRILKKCIEKQQECDGVPQCQDRSDELNCVKDCAHRCDGSRCIPESFVCDGDSDCVDGSDEADCEVDREDEVETLKEGNIVEIDDTEEPAVRDEPLRCSFGSMLCRDGKQCVLFTHLCDNESDCKDNSDEDECAEECESDQFQCAHGKKCIEKQQECDGVPQCQDRSDELNCFEEGCAHRCDGSRCIPESFVCDGESDCGDGSDEADCGEQSCSSDEWRCSSGQCVSIKLHCDGHPDCKDRSDELDCAVKPPCATLHRCPKSLECLLDSWICDGEIDCKDGTDEKDCKESPVQCGKYQWRCSSSAQCIPDSWRCDGSKDCKDGSDEAECPSTACPPHLFQCGSSECLDPSQLCNGVTNCVDGSDEGGSCQKEKCSEESKCAQDCRSSPTGTRCLCRAGFEPVEDALECADVDECAVLPSICSHYCLNTPGSFECSCSEGFVLELDGRGCKVTDEPYLLASVQSEIYILGLRSSELNVLLSDEKQSVVSLDYSWLKQRLYWINLNDDSIRWLSLDQKNRGILIKGVQTESLAVDWVARNLYWTDGLHARISAVGLDDDPTRSTTPVNIISEGLGQIQSIALLPQEGLMFWSETGDEVQIKRAGMDGSDRRVLVRGSLQRPVGLTIDSLHHRIYWTDTKLGCIASADLQGGDIRFLQLTETLDPLSVTVFNDQIYWSDSRRGTIQRAHKVTGKRHQVLLKRPGHSLSLKASVSAVIHPLLQPDVKNPCESRRCSHLCVLAPGPKPVCKCPSQFLLGEDDLTCSDAIRSSFLLFLSLDSVTRVYLQNRSSDVVLQTWPQHHRFNLPGIKKASKLDLVQREHTLYISEDAPSTVRLFKMKEAALVPRGRLHRPQQDLAGLVFAVDHITLNLFWSSGDTPGIQVTSAEGIYTTVLIQDGDVDSIALEPLSGHLCFSNQIQNSNTKILECAYMNGQNRTVVWRKAVAPTSLVLSDEWKRLYWADTALSVIASIVTDGSDYKEIKTEQGLTAFTLVNEKLVWMNKKDTSTECWLGDSLEVAGKLWFKVKAEIVNLKAFSGQKGSNLCSESNGGCSELCLPFPGGRTCRCSHSQRLVDDQECRSAARCADDTKPCLSGDLCVSLEQICNGVPDCPDRSDEICLKYSRDKPAVISPKGFKTGLRESVIPEHVESEECSVTLCNGKGRCVVEDGAMVCHCNSEYSGQFCQNGSDALSRGAVTYGVIGVCGAVVVLAITVGIIQRRKVSRQRRAAQAVCAQETGLKDLERRRERFGAKSNGKDTNVSESQRASFKEFGWSSHEYLKPIGAEDRRVAEEEKQIRLEKERLAKIAEVAGTGTELCARLTSFALRCTQESESAAMSGF